MPTRNIGHTRHYGPPPEIIPVSEQGISNVFASAKGRKFGSWIDDAGRSNAFNSGDLITRTVYQIESIMRDGLGLTNADIHTSSFDSTSLAASYLGHFSWNSQVSAFAKCRDLALDIGCAFFTDHANKVKIVPIYEQPKDFRLVNADIFGNTGIRISRTSPDLIANEIILRYRYDYIFNAYSRDVEVSVDNNTLVNNNRGVFRDGYTTYSAMLTASRTKYNITRRIEIEAPSIRDRAWADELVKHLLDWRSLQRYIVELDLPLKTLASNANQTTADIEIGDYVLLNHDLLPLETCQIAGTQTMSDSALFIVTKVLFDPATVTYKIVLRETPYQGQPTDSELVASGDSESAEAGYGARYGEDYGGGL